MQEIATLVNTCQPRMTHSQRWKGTDLDVPQRLQRLLGKIDPDPVLLNFVLVNHRSEQVAGHLDVTRVGVESPVVRLRSTLDEVHRQLADDVELLDQADERERSIRGWSGQE